MKDDNQPPADYRSQYCENVFHVLGIDGLDIKDLWQEAPAFCRDDGFSGKIIVQAPDEQEDQDVERYTTLLSEASTQGVEVTYMHAENSHLHLGLPWLASIGDVKLAFAFLRALQKMYPECGIFLDDNAEGQFALIEDNYHAMVVRRLINMRSLIENPVGCHIGAKGFAHEFIVPTTEDYPDMEIDELVFKAANTFVELQWCYGDYFVASKADVTTPQGEEYVMRFLTNTQNTFVKVCQHVGLLCENEMKDIRVDDFYRLVEGNPCFKKVDAYQFVMDKMPDEQWRNLFASVPVEPMKMPKTYLLRWNPTISSFTLDHYRQAMSEHPDGFAFDWSVYDWEDAHKGDRYYMLRTGDEHAGIVFRGEFTSEPSEGGDWAGKGKVRHYMDMDCFGCVPAEQTSPISLEVLEREIPEINWRKGRSGELLTLAVAEKLGQLWSELMPDD